MIINRSSKMGLICLCWMTVAMVTGCRPSPKVPQNTTSPSATGTFAASPSPTPAIYKPASLIEIQHLDEVLDSFIVFYRFQIHFEEEKPDVTWMEVEERFSGESEGAYTRKDSMWMSFEFLEFSGHKNTWYREQEDENWRAPPLEIHDPVAMEIYSTVTRIINSSRWKKVGREEVNGIRATHYTLRAENEFPPPSTAVELIHSGKIPWEECETQDLGADIWITDMGYVVREAYLWDVLFTFPDGREFSGQEIIITEVQDINQPVSIPSLDVPPLPPPMSQFDRGKWVEYGWKDNSWTYQTVVEPEDILQTYREHNGEGYIIVEIDPSLETGISITLETQDGSLLQVDITQRETAKNSLVSIIALHQEN